MRQLVHARDKLAKLAVRAFTQRQELVKADKDYELAASRQKFPTLLIVAMLTSMLPPERQREFDKLCRYYLKDQIVREETQYALLPHHSILKPQKHCLQDSNRSLIRLLRMLSLEHLHLWLKILNKKLSPNQM